MPYTTKDYIQERREEDKEFDAIMKRQELAFPIAMEIIRLRDKAGLTQSQLAELIGTKQSAIARLENGDTIPTVQTLNKIAHALHRRLDIHFVEDDEVLYN
ncbi:Helix-turn-helix [Pilibacter termitis]|uniref:Helix-turn-helix n=1 Tax=Pilibacter termitis TaxID=263852 RepID=A0A1T4QQQ5_9ENTE|nr:helix-turn-helix transcriptional regulator [Pilibacter termitis]SKA06109.1 Helix-turn-helix [Pilibacter termitis]